MIRAMEGVSFIKIDDEENRALKEFIYLSNREDISSKYGYDSAEQQSRVSFIKRLDAYKVNLAIINKQHAEPDGTLKPEMMVEANVIDRLNKEGWDYVSHQVVASPFKPITWMKKMDVFAYRYLEGYSDLPKPIEKYLVVEIKKDKGDEDTVMQVMHYVDWICKEYANGDYGRISAEIVCSGYRNYLAKSKIGSAKPDLYKAINRQYIVQTEPLESAQWSDLRLLTYAVDRKTGKMHFDMFADFTV